MRTQLRSSAVDAFVTGILEWSIHRNNEAPLASRPGLHSRGWWNLGPITAFGFAKDGVNGHKNWWRRRELNPRPRKSTAKRLRAFPVRYFSSAP